MRLELLIILFGLLALGFLWYSRSQEKNPTPVTPLKNAGPVKGNGSWLEKLGTKVGKDPWWFPSAIALVSYALLLFFSAILLPEKIWDFWSGTVLCWWLLAIIPLFVLGMREGGIAGKMGAVMLVVISVISLVNDQNFNSTFGETEVEKQARITIKEMARREEFLARQPKVVELPLPVGKWVNYQNKQHKLSYWETKGNECVALAINGGRINLVCTYPEQEQTIIWPFEQKMPKATTLLRIGKNVDLFQIMNLSDIPDTLVLTLDP